MLSHPEQLDRLRTTCPQAAEVAVVAGDPTFDRMLVSLPLRHLYRAALGVRDGQRLILVSSTWGPASLYGRRPDLVHQLRAELPLDDYAVAVALHPNTWSAHTPWQIRRWLNACTRSGVTVFPAPEGWRAGLVAADLIVGDHGSVTFYGASLGRPVVLAQAPHDTVDPASAIGRFLTVAAPLDPAQPLRPQVDAALTRSRSTALEDIANLATSTPLKSHALLRTEFYRLLDLAEPDVPAEASALPVPHATAESAAVQSVHVALEHDDDAVRATVVRYPAALVLRGRPLAPGTHLVVSTAEPSETALHLADVLVHGATDGTAEWITHTLAALPGATVATTPTSDGTWLAGHRDGHQVRFDHTSAFGPALASVALAWAAGGRPLCTLPARVGLVVGPARHEVRATTIRCCC